MQINAQREAGKGGGQPPNLDPRVETREEGSVLTCRLAGNWTTRRVAAVDKAMRAIPARNGFQSLVVDISGVGRMDTAGAWLIERLVSTARAKGIETRVEGDTEVSRILLDAVGDAARRRDGGGPGKRPGFIILILMALGERVYEMRNDFLAAMNILGATIRGGQMKLGRGHGINMAAIFSQIDRMGVGAIPVVVLMSAIVGAIIAQQGAYQLSYFGADIFVVDLVGILVLRELGVLMTAIMIAGRSGSAITAEIGSMKMREEVDALTVIGLNPVGVLVFPRLVALVVALPCLSILANFAALGGGILVSWLYSDIAPIQFIDRLRIAIDTSTIFAGLIKAPFMALIIGIIGAVEGLKVGGSAESLGKHVTASVVKSIFVVIILDGAFAVFYAAIDF
ncbi:ABC transporter permease [Mesorhizobium sp. KR9-304]|uniref:ABC transporter permease n=1 Tax=Mesorhizobium sp. KR9-304 TaxID=3156614 RepID=UPI0032B450BA